VLNAIGEKDQSNAVVVAHGGEGEQGADFMHRIPFGSIAMTGAAGGGSVDEKPDGEFPLFNIALDVRLAGAGGDVPVDGADVIARFVGADFVEVHAAAFEDTAVFAGQQVLDRLSFMRFLGLELGDAVPDAKTIWLFRERLKEAGLVETIFVQFNAFLTQHGFAARKGQIVDASIVFVPKPRNRRDENEKIKQGDVPDDWNEAKRRQKDVDARWTKKRGVTSYGYKNHIYSFRRK